MDTKIFSSDDHKMTAVASLNSEVLHALIARDCSDTIVVISPDSGEQECFKLAKLLGGRSNIECVMSRDARYFVFGARAWRFVAESPCKCENAREIFDWLQISRRFVMAVFYEEPVRLLCP